MTGQKKSKEKKRKSTVSFGQSALILAYFQGRLSDASEVVLGGQGSGVSSLGMSSLSSGQPRGLHSGGLPTDPDQFLERCQNRSVL